MSDTGETKQVTLKGTDIAAAGEKLAQFRDSLPENERNVVQWLIERAAEAPADNEVSGYLGSFGGAVQAPSGLHQVGGVSANPAFQGLGVQQIGRLNPGQLAGISVVVGVMF